RDLIYRTLIVHVKSTRGSRARSRREPGRCSRPVRTGPDAGALVGAQIFGNAMRWPRAFVLAAELFQPPRQPVALPAPRAPSTSRSPRALHWTLRGADTPTAPASRCRTRIPTCSESRHGH